MRARGREINLHLQCFQLEKRHRFICEIANSRCLMWFMPTNKVVWTLILLHLFHNGERKQERSWIILGLQDPFHPGMWKSHFPLPGFVGLSGKAGYHPDHACSSSVMYAARPLRLERNQGGVKHFSRKGNDAKSLCPPPPRFPCLQGVVLRLSTERSLVFQPGEKFGKLLNWSTGPYPLNRHFLSAHNWPGMLLLDESELLSIFWNLGRKHPLKSI